MEEKKENSEGMFQSKTEEKRQKWPESCNLVFPHGNFFGTLHSLKRGRRIFLNQKKRTGASAACPFAEGSGGDYFFWLFAK